MPRKDVAAAPANAQAQQDAVSDGIENYELPKSLVTRIAKSAIPENSRLQKDTVLALVKGSTVFINFLAATAHDIATSRQHKSVSASDVLKALETIQFGDMVEHLSEELQVYRELAKAGKKGGKAAGDAKGGNNLKGKGKERAIDFDSGSELDVGVGVVSGNATTGRNGVGDGDVDEDMEMVDISTRLTGAGSGDEGEGEGEGEDGGREREGGVEVDDIDEDVDMDDEDVDELADDVDEDEDEPAEPVRDQIALDAAQERADKLKLGGNNSDSDGVH